MLMVFTITLNGQTKLLSSISENYDGSSWNKSEGYDYEYDGNNNLTGQIYYDWNTEGQWGIHAKENYTYNAYNKLAEYIYQYWISSANQLENYYKISYTYNPFGNITEIILQLWTGSQWEPEGKGVYSYNSNNIMEMAISYTLNGSQWVNGSRSTITSNSNNKITQSLIEEWTGSQWELSERFSYVYNGNNQITKETGERLNGNSWEINYVVDYTIDANGNVISDKLFELGSPYDQLTEYAYDTSVLMSSLANPFKDRTGIDYVDNPYSTLFVNKILTETHFNYDNATNSYVYSSRTTYNYKDSITLSTENFEISNNSLKVFPNPSKDFIQIIGLPETQSYEVYNTLGAKVSNGVIANNEKMDVKNLTNGLYFLKFKNGITHKFIKE